jgi:ABC-2 type transport system ATP-binding protein
VLLTTHYMDEAQELADRVAVIARGRIVAEGPPATLAGREAMRPTISYRLARDATPPPDLGGAPAADGTIQFTPDDLTLALHRLTGWAIDTGVSLDGLRVLRPSLEDIYLQLTEDRTAGPGTGGADGTAERTPR